ncbi:MAG: group II intron maturase-specific domain-containing protein [Euryarchaeota archaeon]|nr:group II intron maturase-specific domain-containing protein [Euryarchaeota archaeon]
MVCELQNTRVGWAQYHNHAVSTAVFSKLDDVVYNMLVSWAKRRHQNKGAKWVMNKYWHKSGNRRRGVPRGSAFGHRLTD